MPLSDEAVIVLRAAGVSLVLQAGRPMPKVLHWGRDLGDLDASSSEALRLTAIPAILPNSPDSPRVFSVWPTEFEGWSGTPAQRGHAAGRATTPRPTLQGHDVSLTPDAAGGSVTFEFADAISGTRSTLRYTLAPDGVLSVDMAVTRDSSLATSARDSPYDLGGLTAMMPLPERASEIVDFAGRWSRERSVQRHPLVYGTHLRESRRGKPGHDSPFLTLVGTPGFGFGRGEIWGMHVAWSGNQHYLVERLPEGAGAHSAVLGGGESLSAGEVLLDDGDTYTAPTVHFVWSDAGMDGVADRLHRFLRRRPIHPSRPRPLVLNTWEAVYFDHDRTRLDRLVDAAARVGVERVVLDDGWFSGRRRADAGLGDWFVDDAVWPDGLAPLERKVHGLGMEFGLWFEPEMVNLDSELARAHPGWLLAPSEGLGPVARDQYVLNIAHPEAHAYLIERLDTLVAEYRIDYIKWDHNRDLYEAVYRTPDGDRPGVHRQTLALYSLMDELRRRHPALEIETCSGGGGRIDLGILERTDRVWASDCNDPVERMEIERWTSLLLPPELIGSHLGAAVAHTTGRSTAEPYRLIASLFAHAGIEWDLTTCTDEQLDRIAAWGGIYRDLRGLVHSGRVVNADLDDVNTSLRGIVAQDGSTAVFTWSRTATSSGGQSGRVPFPGLDAAADYELRIREELSEHAGRESIDPEWAAAARRAWLRLPGSVLAGAGVPLPSLSPQQALLFEVRRID
jgi:alpha-galactosidase